MQGGDVEYWMLIVICDPTKQKLLFIYSTCTRATQYNTMMVYLRYYLELLNILKNINSMTKGSF